MIRPSSPRPRGSGADPLALGGVEAAGDESLDAAIGVDDAERGVLGLRQLAHAIHDQLQDRVERQDPGDALHRDVEGGEMRLGATGPQLPAQVHGAAASSPIFTPLA